MGRAAVGLYGASVKLRCFAKGGRQEWRPLNGRGAAVVGGIPKQKVWGCHGGGAGAENGEQHAGTAIRCQGGSPVDRCAGCLPQRRRRRSHQPLRRARRGAPLCCAGLRNAGPGRRVRVRAGAGAVGTAWAVRAPAHPVRERGEEGVAVLRHGGRPRRGRRRRLRPRRGNRRELRRQRTLLFCGECGRRRPPAVHPHLHSRRGPLCGGGRGGGGRCRGTERRRRRGDRAVPRRGGAVARGGRAQARRVWPTHALRRRARAVARGRGALPRRRRLELVHGGVGAVPHRGAAGLQVARRGPERVAPPVARGRRAHALLRGRPGAPCRVMLLDACDGRGGVAAAAGAEAAHVRDRLHRVRACGGVVRHVERRSGPFRVGPAPGRGRVRAQLRGLLRLVGGKEQRAARTRARPACHRRHCGT